MLALYDSTQEMVVLKELQAPLTFTRNLKSQVITLIPDSEKDLLSTLSIDSTNKPDIHAELRVRLFFGGAQASLVSSWTPTSGLL